jgi:PAS domain S-box-containing protein
VDSPPLDEPVYLDRDMWEKVVLNLISNALKFTFDGAIVITVRREDGMAVLTVRDTGIGIAPDEMPRLFERFHRIESARARSNEGSGIGLALVKELVGLHGGTIDAESTEQQGTTFAVRIPFGTAHLPPEAVSAEARTRAASAAVDPYLQEALRWLPSDGGIDDTPVATDASTVPDAVVAPVTRAGTPARVLVADDNADMREYLTRLLSTAGYRVYPVANGAEALEAARAEVPDLIVSDVMMPELDGLALVAALRQEPRTVAVPVLLLSARAGQEASIEGLQSGADDYLVKPFAAAELLARVRANVEMARLRNHHSRWRSALVDSMQEAFFVADETGTVIEINAAFTDILGFGPEGLPYGPDYPWWPSAELDPEAHRQVSEVFAALVGQNSGTYIAPVTHRDGHRLWVSASFNHARDPETGRRVMVGTFRDITAEHYTVQSQTALAAINQVLAQADSLDEAVRGAIAELRGVWAAREVLAVTYPAATSPFSAPTVVSATGDLDTWETLALPTRQKISSLRFGDLLVVDTHEPGAAGIALQHPQGVLVLWVELVEQRPFSAEDQTLLTVLAGRVGQGLQRVHQLDQQRETAVALQMAILGPDRLPGGFAVRYQPATRPLQVGGDWYDVVDLEDGRIALIVGDCVGHGLAAAAIMGQMRSACRALLLEHPSPAGALTGLDRFAARLPGAECATAFCGVLSPDTGELVYSSAGHPPPILVHADRSMVKLEAGRDIPLGVRPDRPRPEARIHMPARSTLLMYTDGLVERRRQSLDQGIASAGSLVEQGRSIALDELASSIMTGLAPAGGYQDDVALLLYRQPAPLEMTFPAEVDRIAPTRSALRSWLNRAGVNPEQAQNVLIAAGEAVTNAIEHGHRLAPGVVSLRAVAVADRLELVVTDTGSWKPPAAIPESHRGRGLAIMKALMQDVSIQPEAGGTTVRLSARDV